jgi:putative membrane protein
MGYGSGGHMMYGYGGWFMWIIILVLAVLVIYLFTQQRRAPSYGNPAAGETAMDILKKRLARGEISREEFESLKKDLQ